MKKMLRRLNKQGLGAWLKVIASVGFIVCLCLGLHKDIYQGEIIITALLIATSIIDASAKMQIWRKDIHLCYFVLLVAAFCVPYLTNNSEILDGIIIVCSVVTVILSFFDTLNVWPSSQQLEKNTELCENCSAGNCIMLKVECIVQKKEYSSADEQVLTLQLPLEDLKCILHGKCENCKVKEKSTEKTSKTKYVFKKNQNASFYITMENTISSNGEITLPGANDSLAKEEKINE